MKIALLSEKYTPDPGGLAISAARLASLLQRAGQNVQVFSPSINLEAGERRVLTNDRVRVTRFGAHKRVDDTLVDWVEEIIRSHEQQPFDLLHAYFLPQAGFLAAYLGRYIGIPSVVSIRGNDVERAAFDPAKFSHVAFALQHARAVTTNAHGLAHKAKAFHERDITVIPNGVDTGHFKPLPFNEALAASLGLKRGTSHKNIQQLVLGFVGELREKKGLQTLLDAYTKINMERPATLLIVGQPRVGNDQVLFEEYRQSNPNVQIVVTGYVSHADLPAYYSLMDVFLHPSLRDGLPNALLEAMACGKLVVTTPVGGMKDVIVDGENGLFVPAQSPDELARVVLDLLANPDQQARLGQAARQTVQAQYQPGTELEGNLNLYKSLGLNLGATVSDIMKQLPSK